MYMLLSLRRLARARAGHGASPLEPPPSEARSCLALCPALCPAAPPRRAPGCRAGAGASARRCVVLHTPERHCRAREGRHAGRARGRGERGRGRGAGGACMTSQPPERKAAS